MFMQYFKQLQKKLLQCSKENLQKALGYSSSTKLQQTLQKFLASKDIYSWIHSGFYDFCHSNDSFLKGVAKLCGFKYENLQDELVQQQKYYNALESIPPLRVHTNFKRDKAQSITPLIFASRVLYVKVDPQEFVFASKEQTIKLLQNYIAKHQKQTHGILPIFGKITSYSFKFQDEVLYFNVDGRVIEKDF